MKIEGIPDGYELVRIGTPKFRDGNVFQESSKRTSCEVVEIVNRKECIV